LGEEELASSSEESGSDGNAPYFGFEWLQELTVRTKQKQMLK
jgi:hypothetical protein